MAFVYILKSLFNGSYYKGCTDNITRRFEEHNSRKEKSTARYVPWKLVWYTEKPTLKEARELERKLKNITTVQKLEAFIEKYIKRGPDAPHGGMDADRSDCVWMQTSSVCTFENQQENNNAIRKSGGTV